LLTPPPARQKDLTAYIKHKKDILDILSYTFFRHFLLTLFSLFSRHFGNYAFFKALYGTLAITLFSWLQ
jgi:hypothetical protein